MTSKALAQTITQWVTTTNWQTLANMLWRDMRLLAVRLDHGQRLAMCWVRPSRGYGTRLAMQLASKVWADSKTCHRDISCERSPRLLFLCTRHPCRETAAHVGTVGLPLNAA